MLLKFIPIPIVVLGVLGFVTDMNWWLLACLGAVCALALIGGDALLVRRKRRMSDRS